MTLRGKTDRLGSWNPSGGQHQPRISIIILFVENQKLTEKYYSRFSTSATRSTTMTELWTGWTSTASCAARAPSLTSPPSHATTQRSFQSGKDEIVSSRLPYFSLPSLARRVQAYMGRSSLARFQTTTEPMSWLCNQNRENKSDEKAFWE